MASQESRSQLPRGRSLALLCLLCTGAVALLYSAGFVPLQRIESNAQDLLVRYGRRSPANPRLVYLGIDQSSLSLDKVSPEEIAKSPALQLMQNGWPWSRSVYPLIIQRLVDAGARVVAIDLLFPTPHEGDADFRAALGQYRDKVVIGGNFDDAGSYLPPAESLIPQTSAVDDRVGFVNFWPDELDSVVRGVTYRATIEDLHGMAPREGAPAFASFAGRILEKMGRADAVPAGIRARTIRFTQPFEPRSLYEIFVPGFWDGPAFNHGEFFRDKILVVGPEGNWGKDYLETPLRLMAGTELHLQAVNAALNNDFPSQTSRRVNLLLILLAGLCAWALSVLVAHPFGRLGIFLGLSTLYYTLAQLLYNRAGAFLILFSPLLAMTTSGVVWLAWEQVLERVERARTRRTLERYVSKNLVQEILDNPSSYLQALGGSRQLVTVLFSDLRGFTRLTEQAEGAQLVAQLNEYFTEMVAHVFAQRGTLDKFIGDAIMAVWGNVHSEGPARDVELAVTAALRMQEGLARLNAGWQAAGRPPLAMGIGINHGEAIVGNIGSHEKMDLTVIGDTVNLASRLEGLTKEYGVTLLLGENAALLAGGKFHLQLVDKVQVRGKTKPIDVFTILGAAGAPLEKDAADYLRLHEEAMRLYRAAQFTEAAQLFEKALAVRPGDGVASLYINRCRALAANPPPAPWDGVFVMTRK